MHKILTGETSDFLRIVLPACASGKLDAVKTYLQDDRAFAHWIGPHGRTMVWEAARKGRLDIVRLLTEKYDADLHAIGCYNRETGIEVSPWLIATLRKKTAVADYLAAKGAGLDFHSACFLGHHAFVNRFLRDNPGVVNQPYVREHQWNGYTVWPLQYAIVGRQLPIVTLLLAANADPNGSPHILFDAINTKQLDIADTLLSAGANPRTTSHRGWLVDPEFNELARRYGHVIELGDVPEEKWPELVDACRGNHNMPDDPARVMQLLEQGADINVRDYKHKTPLHRAAQAGFVKISELLLMQGADIEATSDKGETPLFDAAFYGRIAQVELLVKHGANLDARNDTGETPVFAAVRGGQAASLQKLYALGASMDVLNTKGKRIQDIVWRSRKKGIEAVRQLLDDINRTGPPNE